MHGWMFSADAAFALELMVVLFAIALLFAFKVHGKACCKFACWGVKIVLALGVFALACTSYYSIRYWVASSYGMHHKMKHHKKGQGMKMDCMEKKCETCSKKNKK